PSRRKRSSDAARRRCCSTCFQHLHRVHGGKISNWLHETLVPGATVKANGPLGHFVRTETSGRKLLLLSGGYGITPVMSILRELADSC
ncbi:hypothetical protein ACC698_37785, partial [Rhizobium johnstonii]